MDPADSEAGASKIVSAINPKRLTELAAYSTFGRRAGQVGSQIAVRSFHNGQPSQNELAWVGAVFGLTLTRFCVTALLTRVGRSLISEHQRPWHPWRAEGISRPNS